MNGTARARAAEHVEMFARVDRDAGDFAEVLIGRKLEKVDAGVESNLWNGGCLLRPSRRRAEDNGGDGAAYWLVSHAYAQWDDDTCVANTERNTGIALVISAIVPIETRA
jgi:hypothetical protein